MKNQKKFNQTNSTNAAGAIQSDGARASCRFTDSITIGSECGAAAAEESVETEKTPFSHCPVMLTECINGLLIRPDGCYVDCTLGGGGHSGEIVQRLQAAHDNMPGGRLIAIDQDAAAIAAASEHLRAFEDRITYVHRNFSEIGDILDCCGVTALDGALIDLGVSSYQLDTPERGFSYHYDAPLDMRMDTRQMLTAADIVNTYSFQELCRVFRDWGEERFAPAIAKKILAYREAKPVDTTFTLVDIIKSAIPPKSRADGGHPAKRTFQALRIEVNRELDIIAPTLAVLIDHLRPGGRLCVITFHSLEDRIVKQSFKTATGGCTCPRDFPVCICGNKPKIRILTPKPLTASEEELAINNRSHSAKLRIAEKLP